MKNLQSKFKQFELPKESIKKIRGGEDITSIPLLNLSLITDPLRKKDKK
ncbi:MULTISPECIES: hypothetical protein [Flavobacterium]|uniref:Bacteriocin n=1 Tax=Flavobacterium hankyongi TaxID=1176532 RepID=A0ABP9A4P6_9FLAO|nr:hypothetical protein [Flavobacterium sp. N1846]